MFTGIIEEVGAIASVEDRGGSRVFRINASLVLDGTAPGDSIAIDGVCLTVAEITAASFAVHGIATTLERTTLGGFASGRQVNLERALAFGDRLGGHLVQGHVDAIGRVAAIDDRGEHVLIDVDVPLDIVAATVLHGSIAINGISLTVNAIPDAGTVQVSIIPFTLDHTSIRDLGPGDAVNVEGDMIGKYVNRLLQPHRVAGGSDLRADPV
jgi:riboflavin synthase